MNAAAVEYAEKLLSATRDEVARAESKAALLVAGSGVGISALLAGLLGAKWSPFQLHNTVEWLWWLGLACVAAGIVLLGDAVYPRVRPTLAGEAITYFHDVVSVPRTDLPERLEQSVQLRDEQVVDQLVQLSRIVDRKYRSIRYSLWLLGIAVALIIAAVSIDAVLV